MSVRPIRGVATVVVVLLSAQIILMVAAAIALIYRMSLLRRLQSGGSVSQTQGEGADNAVVVVTTIWSFAFLATVVLWCVWQHRAQRSAGEITTGGLRFTPAWAVGWWFIPFANLVKPFQAVRELWKASHGGAAWNERATWHVIGWWWGLWIAGNIHLWFGPNEFGFGFGVGSAGGPTSLSGLISRDTWEIVSLLLRVVAAVLAIVIVRSIVRSQETASALPRPEVSGEAPTLSPAPHDPTIPGSPTLPQPPAR